jgi:perosamine synthetase
MIIPHSKPFINASDLASVKQVIESGHLAQGQKVAAFENAVSRYLKVKQGVAVNSGTSALHLALLALKIGAGDEVIVPSFTCSALLNPIFYVGAKAVVVDVNENDFNISPAEIRKRITRKTKAIIVPHMFGCPADLKEIMRLGVPVIEDLAQSIGAEYQGRKVGSFGTLAICSFYATKVLTTGEGGMVLSNQSKLINAIRNLREYDEVEKFEVRYNYKMTDLQAALGLSQLSRLPDFIARRKRIAKAYDAALAGQNAAPFRPADCDHIFYRYVVKNKKLAKKSIQAVRPVFKPLHHYVKSTACPVSDLLMKQCLSIPIYPALTDAQIKDICKAVL